MIIQIHPLKGITYSDAKDYLLRKDLKISVNENQILVIYGYLYNTSKHTWITTQDLAQADDIFTVREQYLDGSGSVIRIDLQKNVLDVYTDPYRLYCLYRVEVKDAVYISDSLVELNENIPFTLNNMAAVELSVINCTVGNKTIYNEAEILEEGFHFQYSVLQQKVVVGKNAFSSFPVTSGNQISLAEFNDAFTSHVKTGLKLAENISLALTAGLDSRCTLAASLSSKEKLHTYTHGFYNSNDVKLAKRISRKVGVQHKFYDLENIGFIQSIPEYSKQVNTFYEGQLNGLSHAHAILSYTQQQQVAETFFSSFGGELLRSYYLPDGLPPKVSLDAMADGIRRISAVKIRMPVFQKSEAEVIESLNQSIYAELKNAPDNSSYEALADYYYHRRNFNSVTTRFAGKYFKIFNPYFSKQLYKLVPDLPAHSKVLGEVQKFIVQRNSSILRNILLNSNEPVVDNFTGKLQAKAARIDYLRKVFINKISNRWTYRLYFTDYDNWIKQYHAEWFMDAFKKTEGSSQTFNSTELQSFVKKYLTGEQSFAYYRFLTNIFSYLNFINK